VQRRGGFQYNNVLCSNAASPVRRPMLSHSGAPNTWPVQGEPRTNLKWRTAGIFGTSQVEVPT
jgi:hypothetical protein